MLTDILCIPGNLWIELSSGLCQEQSPLPSPQSYSIHYYTIRRVSYKPMNYLNIFLFTPTTPESSDCKINKTPLSLIV